MCKAPLRTYMARRAGASGLGVSGRREDGVPRSGVGDRRPVVSCRSRGPPRAPSVPAEPWGRAFPAFRALLAASWEVGGEAREALRWGKSPPRSCPGVAPSAGGAWALGDPRSQKVKPVGSWALSPKALGQAQIGRATWSRRSSGAERPPAPPDPQQAQPTGSADPLPETCLGVQLPSWASLELFEGAELHWSGNPPALPWWASPLPGTGSDQRAFVCSRGLNADSSGDF